MDDEVMGNGGDLSTVTETAPETPRKRRLWVWVMAVVILLAGSGAGCWYWTTTPQYSLHCIAKAAEQHDLVAFKKYVDLESVTNRGVSQLIEVFMNDPDEVQNDFDELAQGLIEALKPELVKQFTTEIETYIEKGEFEKGSKDEGISPTEFLKKTGDQSDPSFSIGNVKKEGKIAVVELNIEMPEYKSTLTADIKMRDRGKYWQVAEIANFGQLIKKLDELEKAKLAELNLPIQKQLNQLVTIGGISVQQRPDEWGFDQYLDFYFDSSINGTEPISEIITEFRITDAGGNLLLKDNPQFEGNWEPGYRGPLTWSKDINPFIESDTQLWETPIEQLNMEIRPISIIFAGGREIKLMDEVPAQ